MNVPLTLRAKKMRLPSGDHRSEVVPRRACLGPSAVTPEVRPIPATAHEGTYFLLACADDLLGIAEVNEKNNCMASSGRVTVALPDLAIAQIGHPSSAAPGLAVTFTDTVHNSGKVPAASSSNRYYLSVDQVKDAGDLLLTGARSVPIIAAEGSASGSRAVTVPVGTPLGTYLVIACADGLSKVREANETNNCRTPGATLVVGLPDLVITRVTSGTASAVPGGKLTLADTVSNLGNAPAGASTSQYYRSRDSAWDAADLLLSGTRSVTALAPGAVSTGSRSVTLSAATPEGHYSVLACADGLAKVVEVMETNNCVASAATILVGGRISSRQA